jgi:hypothetical protein
MDGILKFFLSPEKFRELNHDGKSPDEYIQSKSDKNGSHNLKDKKKIFRGQETGFFDRALLMIKLFFLA